MIRKYWWLVVSAVSVFIFDALLLPRPALMSTEPAKCRNMHSVNPPKLVNCSALLLNVSQRVNRPCWLANTTKSS